MGAIPGAERPRDPPDGQTIDLTEQTKAKPGDINVSVPPREDPIGTWQRVGWDVERDGLQDAPNTGSFDPFAEIMPIVRELDGAWLHVDGALGMWALASPTLRHVASGIQDADSWATDAHKWLNVPYDSGLVFVRDAEAQRRAMALPAAYLIHAEERERDPYEFVPEFSRRARGFAVYAAIRSLGREGIVEMVDRHCRQARRFAERLGAVAGVQILNDVVLNQVLVRFEAGDGADATASDGFTREVVRRVQEEGTCWLAGTTWHQMAAMRISISNWATSDDDVERSADAILRCFGAAQES